MRKSTTKALSGSTTARTAVDWLTTTASDEGRAKALWGLGNRLLCASEDKGELPTRRHLHGYTGFAVPHCFVGARADGCYLRLSGQESAEHWLEALTAAENCSRLDIAVDTHFDSPVSTLSDELYHKSPDRCKHGGRPPMKKLVCDTNGGTTVYFGSRSSERFGRVYDKGRESKTLMSGLWWRWELELKDTQSAACSKAMLAAADATTFMLGVACRFFQQRAGCAPAKNTWPALYKCSQEAPTAAKLLHWISSGVRPTVARLIEVYGRERVLTALGIPPSSAVDARRVTAEQRGEPWHLQPARSTR